MIKPMVTIEGGGSQKGEGARFFVILSDQLFAPETLKSVLLPGEGTVIMIEDAGLFTRDRFHILKIAHAIASMREYKDQLERAGYRVHYTNVENEEGLLQSFEEKLLMALEGIIPKKLETFEVADLFLEKRIRDFALDQGIEPVFHPSPAFLTPFETGARWVRNGRRPFVAYFYEHQRRRMGVLMDALGRPEGGRMSYELDNRKNLPDTIVPPKPGFPVASQRAKESQAIAEKYFPSHSGFGGEFWLPIHRTGAKIWLEDFLEKRLKNYGPFQDAISHSSVFIYHSGLSTLLNTGLLTPSEVVDRTIHYSSAKLIPIASVEGFLRQVIGWREFMKIAGRVHYEKQRTTNHWNATRKLTNAWNTGELGMPLADQIIAKVQKWGYAHHNERLMVMGNLMTLCEIEPTQAYHWFMANFVDAAEWVTAPNVYGLGICSDGGSVSLKPFIAGSQYWGRMSDIAKGDWAETLDGLYWRFLDRNRENLLKDTRATVLYSGFGRMEASRRKFLISRAEEFLERTTTE